jgi:hypothetical protein
MKAPIVISISEEAFEGTAYALVVVAFLGFVGWVGWLMGCSAF